MRHKIKTNLGYILAVIFLLSTIGLYIYSSTLKNKFEENETQNSVVAVNINDNKIEKIDSLLFKGNYTKALSFVDSIMKNGDLKSDAQINLRFQLLQDILDLKKKIKLSANKEKPNKISVDSLLNAKDTKIDSLKLAMVNMKVDLYFLEEKIDSMKVNKSKKTYGEYLTFSTTKGKTLHYVGEVKDNKANGYGIAILETGSRYEGNWKNSKRHGKGKFYWDDGEHYEGQYEYDLRQGYGTYFWNNGEKYIGEWKNDMRDGQGKFFSEDGSIIAEGIWQKDKLEEK